MTKRKERPVEALYHATKQIPEAEMTPVLKGNFHIQGPLDVTDCTENKMSSSRSEKKFSRRSAAGKVGVKSESGTCNVCAAPCSSCNHFKQTVSRMEIKVENEFSDEVSRVNEECSFTGTSVTPCTGKQALDSRNPTASETSNILSASSSHDSLSENAESKASLRTVNTNEDEVLPKDLLGGGVSREEFLNKPQGVAGHSVNISSNFDVPLDAVEKKTENLYEVQNGCNGDDVSCVSGANDAHTAVRDCNVDLDGKNVSCSTSSSPERSEKMSYDQSDPGALADAAVAPAKSVQHSEIDKAVEKSSSLPQVTNNEDPSLQSQSGDVSDESDFVENDVKVCDICGDAGREDLLAVCSRCSDGAEHTYCMRIYMEKVPEGDWLCEGCQLKEEVANHKKDKHETVLKPSKLSSSNEKSEKTVASVDSKISHKPDTHVPEEETNKATKVLPSSRLTSKRPSDNLEVLSVAKRQALDSGSGSPKPSNLNKTNALSRDRSSKDLDKANVKPINKFPALTGSSAHDTTQSSTIPVQNSSKIHPQLQSPKGTLLRASSFNTSNAKPKVKMVPEEIPQKNKLGKHLSASGSRKEGLGRMISKSSSFNIGTSHSSSTESKGKVHSNFSRSEDLKGIKLSKERNIERKNSFRSDRLVSPRSGLNVSSLKDEQRVSSRGENVSLPSTTKFRDMNAVQAEVRLSTSSKSTSLLPPRGSETSNALTGRGDFKRQSSLVSRSGGFSSLNGNVAEKKASQVNSKDNTAINLPCAADGASSNSDVVLRDGFPQPLDSTDRDKKCEEPSVSQSWQTVPATSVRCHKCQEIGHAAQFCPNVGMRALVHEATAARSSREVMNRTTKTNDANEASTIKNSGVCQKSGLHDQSDDLCMPSTELTCDVPPRDQLSKTFDCAGNVTSSNGSFDRQGSIGNMFANFGRSTDGTSGKQGGEQFVPKALDLNASVSLVENQRSSSCDLQNQRSSSPVPSRISSIPAQDYIWQGGFEVQKSGKYLDSFNGIQAHLSMGASPKVLEVVNKLPRNVLLEEVSRASTWPTQFQNCATEDNIALYFFARDVESHIRSYQSLVENMMKNDLALKGILDGIELLIFPSNQLCENSKRWNMLYFLWGVFRAKRVNVSEKLKGSLKNLSADNMKSVPMKEELSSSVTAVMQNVDENLPAFGRKLSVQDASNSSLYTRRVDRKDAKEESSSAQNCSMSLPMSAASTQLCIDTKGIGTSASVLDHEYPNNKEEKEPGRYSMEEPREGKSVISEEQLGLQTLFPTSSDQGRYKRPHSSIELLPQASSESSARTTQLLPWIETSTSEENPCKKLKSVYSDTTSERYFFPVEAGPTVEVISSDEEDELKPGFPNLDLVLGGENKKNKRPGGLFELLAKAKNDDLEDGEDGEDLSLSLAVPFSEPEKKKKKCLDTSLFLFGGFPGK